MDEQEQQFGPAMMALTEMQRRFVMAMARDPFGTQKDWAIAAGYSNSSEGAKVTASGLMSSPKVEAAVLEYSRGLLAAEGPIIAATALMRIAANPKHPQHLRAVEMLANRVGLHEVQQVHVHRTDDTGDALIRRIERAAAALGIDAGPLLGGNAPKLIEGKAVDG